jgi:uncharacterized protein (DUF58 family)
MRVAGRAGLTGANFIDPAALARIGSLELLARAVVEGFINGLHKAPHLGVSMDFAEHRQYMPGDDIRRIDWKVFGRTDRYYVKQFEAETNTNFVTVLDASTSMRWGSGAITKLDYAKFLTASLAYFSGQQRDRVGIATIDDRGLDAWVPPSAKHLEILLHTVERAPERVPVPDAGGRLGGVLDSMRSALGRRVAGAADAEMSPVDAGDAFVEMATVLADRVRRRGFVLLVSDLYVPPERVRDGVGLLRSKGQDVIVFHILDPAELEFPFREAQSFADLETGERMPVVPDTIRARYRELVRTHIETLRSMLTESRVDYTMIETTKPLDHALFSYLSARQRMIKGR